MDLNACGDHIECGKSRLIAIYGDYCNQGAM